MNKALFAKLDNMCEQYDAVCRQLTQAEITANSDKYRALCRECAQLKRIVDPYEKYKKCITAGEEAQQLMKENDQMLKQLAKEEWLANQKKMETLEKEIKNSLLAGQDCEHNNVFLEIRAGTGGREAAIFAGDLFTMYSRYAEAHRWLLETASVRESESGGFKEIISRIVGDDAWAKLRYESGVHRVQRVPETESQGRIHTSAATVAVLPEAQTIDDIEINNDDLKIDTFRASGAGGQHVNKTDSAIRITHRPSGLVVECQEDRSQHRNKAQALALLKARLLDKKQKEQQAKEAAARKTMVGSGDRSQRIRTYNFPQGRVTDHRIGLTLYQLSNILEGDLDPLIVPLTHQHQLERLSNDGDDAHSL